MTAYDWLMAGGVVVIIAFLIKAFWRANRIEAREQPDQRNRFGGPPNDSPLP